MGAFLSLGWTVLMLGAAVQPRADAWILVGWLVGSTILFGLGWSLVRFVAWVVAGFRLDRGQ
jgi:hypothetical protein